MPADAASADAFDDAAPVELFPEELALLTRAVDKRRREFTTVRGCARRALAGLGLPPTPLLPGRRNAPRWPEGVVGSMTHCSGYRAAAVARSSGLASIGIDAEPALPLPDGVLESIALPAELARARQRPAGGPTHPDRLLFSAKEAVYKAWYPMVRTELDFHDAELTFVTGNATSPGQRGCSGTFEARILGPLRAPGAVTTMSGRWMDRDGLLVTAVTVPARR